MKFTDYLDHAWADHALNPNEVAADFEKAQTLLESPDQLVQIANLITHVMGEHLGKWTEGTARLVKLKTHPIFSPGSEADQAIRRSIAALEFGSGIEADLSELSTSDQIRTLAVAASALGTHDITRAGQLFQRALKLVDASLTSTDPANRALAITGNNLACTLEEKSERSATESELMILAAETGRKFWERAGGWLEVAIAEYRLAMTYLQAGETGRALHHAQKNIEICREHHASDRNMFFGYEALALTERKRENKVGFDAAFESAKAHFANLNDEDKAELASSMNRLA